MILIIEFNQTVKVNSLLFILAIIPKTHIYIFFVKQFYHPGHLIVFNIIIQKPYLQNHL